ncbi:hypothetical protein WSM22_15810 [Cytophagales bacterium WSM2-2]|nr:hypothetical protein WSM22_15810 [Cytophagales bacterium WSM2-2]
MKRALISLGTICVLIACQQKKSGEVINDSTSLPVDTVVYKESQSDSLVLTTGFQGTEFGLKDLDTSLQDVFERLHDSGKLNSLIHPQLGCYLITEGAGVYPVTTEVKSSSLLLANKQFSSFINELLPVSGYYLNPAGVDNCNPPEGFFVYDFKDSQFLYRTYQSQLSATDETVPDDKAERLHALDAAFVKNVFVSLPAKDGSINAFDIYIARIDGKHYLAAIDTRGCGI